MGKVIKISQIELNEMDNTQGQQDSFESFLYDTYNSATNNNIVTAINAWIDMCNSGKQSFKDVNSVWAFYNGLSRETKATIKEKVEPFLK